MKPRDQYTEYQYNPTSYPLNQTGYPLNQNGLNQNSYQFNPNLPLYLPNRGYPGYGQNNYQQYVPYNILQNKEKDQKSKLSFYVTIELELYPGKSASLLQKSIVKCQSNFERIREAWADIFGFQYRPAPMSEAYSYVYDVKSDNDKNKTEKNKSNDKNSTRKKR
jgi:hypothetical protein